MADNAAPHPTGPPMGAIILAGGSSSRMKTDKALLKVGGVTLLEKIARELEPRFAEIIISMNPRQELDFPSYTRVTDDRPGQGPMMGVLAGLRAARRPVNFVIACDIPEINFDFLRRMIPFTEDHDVVVPVTADNKLEPLFAFYHRRVIPRMESLLDRGIRKIIDVFPLCRTKYVPLENANWFRNLNTNEDYRSYIDSLKNISRQERQEKLKNTV